MAEIIVLRDIMSGYDIDGLLVRYAALFCLAAGTAAGCSQEQTVSSVEAPIKAPPVMYVEDHAKSTGVSDDPGPSPEEQKIVLGEAMRKMPLIDIYRLAMDKNGVPEEDLQFYLSESHLESNHHPEAVSSSGAMGLFQVTGALGRDTAAHLGLTGHPKSQRRWWALKARREAEKAHGEGTEEYWDSLREANLLFDPYYNALIATGYNSRAEAEGGCDGERCYGLNLSNFTFIYYHMGQGSPLMGLLRSRGNFYKQLQAARKGPPEKTKTKHANYFLLYLKTAERYGRLLEEGITEFKVSEEFTEDIGERLFTEYWVREPERSARKNAGNDR